MRSHGSIVCSVQGFEAATYYRSAPARTRENAAGVVACYHEDAARTVTRIVARWWMLMTSGEYGFERDIVEKAAVDRMPVPHLGDLSGALRAALNEIVADWRAAKSWLG